MAGPRDAPAPGDHGRTTPLGDAGRGEIVRRFRLRVVDGPSRGKDWQSSGDRCSIGSHPSNDLVVDDPTVSRFHCEIRLDGRGARVRDLDSRNGTLIDGVPVVEGWLREQSTLKLGRSSLQYQPSAELIALPLSEKTALGPMVGRSAVMRGVFALIERAAASDATVLVEGETGTGKEGVAEALHLLSPRRDQPLVVVDCGAIPENLLESELFGHEKGAFTGASDRRVGAFEKASGGTIFLDEIGELPSDLQPKLLRVLEKRELRRIGSSTMMPVDIRVVAATNRDLRTAVNAGTFRADLFFRLAVVRVVLPPLRSRLEDLPLLVERLLDRLGGDPAASAALRTPEFVANLARAAWPGNVRELRNHLERCLLFQQPLPLAGDEAHHAPGESGSYAEARRRALADFERAFVERLLAKHGGNVARAAEEAGINRVYLHRLIARHRV